MRKLQKLKFLIFCFFTISLMHCTKNGKTGVYINCSGELLYYNYPNLWVHNPSAEKISIKSLNEPIVDENKIFCISEPITFKLKVKQDALLFDFKNSCSNLFGYCLNYNKFEYIDLTKKVNFDSIRIYPLMDSLTLYQTHSNKEFSSHNIENKIPISPEQEIAILFSNRIDTKLNFKTSNPTSIFVLYLSDGTYIRKKIHYLPYYLLTFQSLRYKGINFAIE